MVKNRYKNNLQDFGCLANYWIFIQNGTLLPTGISFPNIFIKEWESIHEAARTLSLQVPNIHKVCNGERKTCGGFHWKYK